MLIGWIGSRRNRSTAARTSSRITRGSRPAAVERRGSAPRERSSDSGSESRGENASFDAIRWTARSSRSTRSSVSVSSSTMPGTSASTSSCRSGSSDGGWSGGRESSASTRRCRTPAWTSWSWRLSAMVPAARSARGVGWSRTIGRSRSRSAGVSTRAAYPGATEARWPRSSSRACSARSVSRSRAVRKGPRRTTSAALSTARGLAPDHARATASALSEAGSSRSGGTRPIRTVGAVAASAGPTAASVRSE